MQASVGKGFRGGGNEYNPASCRLLVRTQETPQRGRERGQRVLEEEKRAEVAEVLLAVGRCLLAPWHQQGRLQVRAKVEEVNIV